MFAIAAPAQDDEIELNIFMFESDIEQRSKKARTFTGFRFLESSDYTDNFEIGFSFRSGRM